jgi:hypothetical protein
MNIETLRVTINRDGQVEIEVDGVHGPVCLELTDELIKALGQMVSQDLSSQYFEEEEVPEHQTTSM